MGQAVLRSTPSADDMYMHNADLVHQHSLGPSAATVAAR
jgi:hypothetical protein